MKEPWEMTAREYRLEYPRALGPRGRYVLTVPPHEWTDAWFAARSLAELRTLAVVMGAPHSGTKEELIRRIDAWWGVRAWLSSKSAEELRALPRKELVARAKSVGVYSGLNKYGLANALIGWRDRCRLNGQVALAAANHFLEVRRAVRRGLPVPAEVLAEYPGLEHDPADMPLFAGVEE